MEKTRTYVSVCMFVTGRERETETGRQERREGKREREKKTIDIKRDVLCCIIVMIAKNCIGQYTMKKDCSTANERKITYS